MNRHHVANGDSDRRRSIVTICNGALRSLQRVKHVSRSSNSQPCVYTRNPFIRRNYATCEDEKRRQLAKTISSHYLSYIVHDSYFHGSLVLDSVATSCPRTCSAIFSAAAWNVSYISITASLYASYQFYISNATKVPTTRLTVKFGFFEIGLLLD